MLRRFALVMGREVEQNRDTLERGGGPVVI